MIFDTAPNIALQATAPGLGMFMLLLSALGSAEFYLIIIPAIIWCYDRTFGVLLLLLCSVSVAINVVLKLFFHSPRPYWISADVQAFGSEPTFGLPSAAAQVSLTFLGYTGAWFRKRAVWVICGVLVVLVGIARMYLGVHFPGDVLGGWIAALAILLLFLHYETAATAWFLRMSVSARILLALALSSAFIIISHLVIAGYGTWQVPAGWAVLAFAQTGQAIDPGSLKDTMLAAGLLFGAIAGAGIGASYVPYRTDGTRARRATRYLLGILVLAILWLACSAATKAPGWTGLAIVYLRAALATLWITAGAPYLFCRFGLMERE